MGVRIGWDRGVDVRSASYQLHRSWCFPADTLTEPHLQKADL